MRYLQIQKLHMNILSLSVLRFIERVESHSRLVAFDDFFANANIEVFGTLIPDKARNLFPSFACHFREVGGSSLDVIVVRERFRVRSDRFGRSARGPLGRRPTPERQSEKEKKSTLQVSQVGMIFSSGAV